MIPRTLPAGTTLRSFVEEVLPADHAASVPKDAGDARMCVSLGRGPSFALTVTGDRLAVRDTDRVEAAPLLVRVEEATAQAFLDDWMGPRRLAPSFEPRGVACFTDPRLLRKVAAVKGVVSVTLDDLGDGRSATLLVASGPDASLYDDPDVSVRVSLPAYLQIVAGKIRPDEALAQDQVTVTGKKRIAMQFALVLVPYFPVRE
jgi:hypothetical protein